MLVPILQGHPNPYPLHLDSVLHPLTLVSQIFSTVGSCVLNTSLSSELRCLFSETDPAGRLVLELEVLTPTVK